MPRIVTFGEIMLRAAPPGQLRLQQTLPGTLEFTFAGAEANVAASLAMLHQNVSFVTALPDTPTTEACLCHLRGLGVQVSHIRILDRGRFGLYFVENGANQRPPRVTYDREYSSISMARPEEFPWEQIFADAEWLHLTSITAALSESAARLTLAAIEHALRAGVRISCDVNFRSRLWKWRPSTEPRDLAAELLRQIIPSVTLLSASAEDCQLVGINLTRPNSDHPDAQADFCRQLAETVTRQFPNVQYFSTTLRQAISASHNNWGGMLFETSTGTSVFSPLQNQQWHPYPIQNIVDRVGAGDAFAAGLLYGLTHSDFDLQRTIDFATAASCLAHSIVGDFNFSRLSEIEELMAGNTSGRVVR
ncbi:MAG: sugar kinase [Planctomycetaceae bacterium]|nr:sugar kinase [Planctomycetaceae bacterium]